MHSFIQACRKYFDPESGRCKERGDNLSIFNKYIFLSLIIGNSPNIIGRANDSTRSVFRLIFLNFFIWILLPLGISISQNIIVDVYNLISKNYLLQLLICIIGLILVVFTFSYDLEGKIKKII